VTRFTRTATALLVAVCVTVALRVEAQAPPAQTPPAQTPPAQAPPALTPPRLLAPASLALPDGTAPLPEGSAVGLQLDIDREGAVVDVVVLEPLREDVDPHVVEAARALRFEPARRGDTPIPARVRFRFAVQVAAPADAPDAPPAQPPAPASPPVATTASPSEPTPGATSPSSDATASAAPGASTPSPTMPPAEPPEAAGTYGARARVVPREPGAASRVVLTGEELTTVPGTLGEPLRVVGSLPGVGRTPFGLGFYVVRGASFENTGFFVDGYPVPLLYHLAAGPAVISSRLVERLDFYPGGYPASYGRFNAGIIALHTAPPARDSFSFELELDVFRASALAVVPFPERRGSLAVALRRSYYELLLPLVVDGVSLSFTDWQVRLDYALSRRVRASLFVFGSEDALDTSAAVGSGETSSTATTSLGYGFSRAIAKLEARLPGKVRLTWSGTVGRDASGTRRREPGSPDLALDLSAIFLGERAEMVWQPNERLRTHAGLDLAAFVIDASAQLPLPPGFGEIPSPDFDPQVFGFDASIVSSGVGAFVEQKVALGPLEVTGGLRVDHYRYGEVSTALVQPRLVARYAVTPKLTIKAASGLFSQTPQPFQLLPTLGSASLAPNRSWQSSVGVELTLPLAIEIESQLYLNRMYGLARPSTGIVPEGEGARRQFFFDDGEGRAYGLELLVRRKVAEGLYGWLSYTLSRSERFVEGGQAVLFNFDQTHILSVAASYKVWRFRFGARMQVSTGRPAQTVTGAVYDADSGRYRPVLTGLTGRLPTYHQLDLRVDYEFPLGPFEASIYLDGINVYNAPNAEGTLYQYDLQRSARLPGLPALATLGFRLIY